MMDRERKRLSLSSIQVASRFDCSSTSHFAWPSKTRETKTDLHGRMSPDHYLRRDFERNDVGHPVRRRASNGPWYSDPYGATGSFPLGLRCKAESRKRALRDVCHGDGDQGRESIP